ncbi:MAG: LON peptidase substrate-binding domain-containing protein, partial [Planctomycetota bacterium]
MDAEPEVIRIDLSKPLRLFPLPAVVLLPHAAVPLHVFEPRYRALLRDALDSDGLMGMAVYAEQESDIDEPVFAENDQPPLRPCVAVGRLVKDERLDDGRHNILLHGVCRVRILEELPLHEDGYRLARVEPFGHEPDAAPADVLDAARRRLAALVEDDRLDRLSVAEGLRRLIADDDIPTEAFVDLAALAVNRGNGGRYAALAEADPLRRAELLEVQLAAVLEMADDLPVDEDPSYDASDDEPEDDAGWPLD